MSSATAIPTMRAKHRAEGLCIEAHLEAGVARYLSGEQEPDRSLLPE